MRMGFRLTAVPLVLLATSLPAFAVQTSTDIVVRGTRLDPSTARDRATDFVKRTGVANGQQQVARWVVPVCVKVIGLSTAQAGRVEDLMLSVAQQANIRAGGPGCEPNITVTFASDAKQIARVIHQRRPHQLRELSGPERERVLEGAAPVRWWYATQMLDRDGVGSNNISPGWISAGDAGGGAVVDPVSVGGSGDITSTQQYNSGSNVRTPTIRSLYGATVIVDAPTAGDRSIDSIAAYVAMVAFAEMGADNPPPDSILGLFQPESAESSLTDWDLAFLKSLYRMPLDRRSRIQRGHLVEALLDERLPRGQSGKP